MPDKTTKPLNPTIIAADRESVAALKNVKNYAPSNPAYSLENLINLQTDMDAKLAASAQADAEARAKRDDGVAAAWAYHQACVGMKDAVGVQYGKDSNEFQTVGRKKTTEYKKPTRKPKKPSA